MVAARVMMAALMTMGVWGNSCAGDEMDLCEGTTQTDREPFPLTAIRIAELQLDFIQQMTEEFLLVAYPIDKAKNKKKVAANVLLFDNALHDLIKGNASRHLQAPTQQNVKDKLAETRTVWDAYKLLLESNINTVGPKSPVLMQIHVQSQAIMHKSEEVLQLYVGVALAVGLEEVPAKTYTRHANVLCDTIRKDLLFVGHHTMESFYLEDIIAQEIQMKDIQHSLTYGSPVAGIPELAQKCLLFEMFGVEKVLVTYRKHLLEIGQTKKVSENLLINMVHEGELVSYQMHHMLLAFEHNDEACDATSQIDDEGWYNLITETNKQLMLAQKATRLYLQLARGGHMEPSDVLAVTQVLDESQADLRKCMKGSVSDNIPSPPTQEIVDALMRTWKYWKQFDEDVRHSLALNLFSPEELNNKAYKSEAIWQNMRQVCDMCVDASLKIKPLDGHVRRSIIWGVSERQAPLLERISTEALFVSFESRSKAALVEHQGFIKVEASMPFKLSSTESRSCFEAVLAFKSAWDSYKATDEERSLGLRREYITLNKYPLGEKHKLDVATGVAMVPYHTIHLKYHPHYRKVLYERNYYDVFMLDLEGNLIYSVHKEDDYALNYAASGNGQWKTSGLGEAFEAAMAHPDRVNVIDWKPYGPSAGALASFLSIGVKDANGKMVGVFGTHMPPGSKPTNFEAHKAHLVSTRKAFESSHWQLLRGRSAQALSASEVKENSTVEAVLYKGKALPRTTDACTLNVMAEVLRYFGELTGLQERLISDNHTNSSKGLVTTIKQIDAVSPLAANAMVTAVHYFKDGKGVCTTNLTETVWEIGLQESGTIPYLLQKSMTEYYLLARGLPQTWMNRSNAALVEHQGFIKVEASMPFKLSSNESRSCFQAILAFKSAWDSYKATDEERSLGLRLAYITLNKYPLGEKHKLDVATGVAMVAYHTTHLMYHPHYRKVLYERNYYDIFMLDLEGNLIYSVHKEDDYATNFAASGNGQWKTSGLGEAFEEAMAHPDRINVIDWKPYGPSAGALASFLSIGVKDASGKMVGVFGTHMPPDSKPHDAVVLLSKALEKLDYMLKGFKFGGHSRAIPPPVNQAVSDKLFTLSDEWAVVRPVLAGSQAAFIAAQGYIKEVAHQPILVDAVLAFKSAWNSYRATDEERALGLRALYITLNKYPDGEKDKLDVATGSEDYHTIHLKYHPHYRQILHDHHFYDVFMFDLTGNLIYSVHKENDYATNFAASGNGQWKTSGLGEAFEAAMAHPDRVNVMDWKPYGASHGALASFLSIGVKDANGQMVGVFGTHMPPDSKPIDPVLGVALLMKKNTALIRASEAFLQSYVHGASSGAPALQRTRVSLVSLQRQIIQGMNKQAVLLGMSNITDANKSVTRGGLSDDMTLYESNHVLLVKGGTIPDRKRRLLVNNNVKEIKDQVLLRLFENVHSSWLPLKVSLKTIADGGPASEPVLRAVVTKADKLVSVIDKVFVVLATTTRTTTLMTLEILAPMPFTGAWAAGATMKLASLVAEGMINEQQKILPGYNLKSVFFDDKCDSSVSSQIVLGEMAKKDTYLALGGGGCSQVCASTSFLATTQHLPFLSYECPAATLSDVKTYPKLTRFGTVTTAAIDVITAIGKNFSWPLITIISGDPSKYRVEAEGLRDAFTKNGIGSNYVYAFDNEWDEILAMMSRLKIESKGKQRVYLLVGTEEYFRKVICASIVAKADTGITWLSKGTWSDEWWKNSNMLETVNRHWLEEDVAGDKLKDTFSDFKKAWDDYRPNGTDDGRGSALAALYATDAKEKLDVAAGAEQYHTVHKKLHPAFRQTAYDRNYYDIFLFDLKGNCIYSTHKESDYATNFAASGTGKWKDSGLGDAFRTALANPNNVSYIDWKAYGPSKGALAAFLSTGIRKKGVLVGVYTIRLPPDYQRSIEQVQSECSLEAITNSFEGAINVGGLGRPSDQNMGAPLPCFDGHSPQSFLTLLDQHLSGGYPLGNKATKVAHPYGMIKANAADAICVIAFTVKYLLEQGHAIEEIQKPHPALYEKFIDYVKNQIDFQGASGRVKFSGNDKPGYLVVQQVKQGLNFDVGLVSPDDGHAGNLNVNMIWVNGGPNGTTWKREKTDPPPPDNFPYWAVKAFPPVILLGGPIIAGIISGWRRANQEIEAK